MVLKQLVKGLLGRWGYEIRSADYQKHQYTKLINVAKPVIFDVGANEGQSLQFLRTQFPTSVIHAFEPDPQVFERLVARFKDPEIILNNIALGADTRKGTLYRCRNTGSNSLLKPNVSSKYNLGGALVPKDEIEVDVTTVDEYCLDHGIDKIHIVKTDTQGYDLRVLRGAAGLLDAACIDVIKTEIVFCDLYNDRACFLDFERLLNPCGYWLYTLENINISFDGRLTHLDAVYVGPHLRNIE